MKRAMLATAAAFLMLGAIANPCLAEDSKIASGAKAIGKGIMWGPKKLWQGAKAMGNGMKKMVGK